MTWIHENFHKHTTAGSNTTKLLLLLLGVIIIITFKNIYISLWNDEDMKHSFDAKSITEHTVSAIHRYSYVLIFLSGSAALDMLKGSIYKKKIHSYSFSETAFTFLLCELKW